MFKKPEIPLDPESIPLERCPECETEFQASPPWDSGKCPKCGKPYYWDEMVTEDDSWAMLDWRSWDEV